MDGNYKYNPRFVDIRIKKPKDQPSAKERVCEHPKCRSKATARSPKTAAKRNEFYWFCQRHAAEYNKQWNFFEGMSEEAAREHMNADFYGHRPTWSFAAGSTARKKAQRATKDFHDGFEDPFSVFGDRPPPSQERRQREAEDPHAAMGRLQRRAYEALSLEPGATKAEVRKRYAELVRAYHPDSNGGDRSMEELLTKVVQSYQILKGAGMA
jgi:DnaJ-domain-containing protein 1